MLKKISGKKFAGRRVLVVGLGLHGGAASAIRWFSKQGALLRVQDVKTKAELRPTLKQLAKIPATYHLGGHLATDFDWAQSIYLNQGVGGEKALALVEKARRRGVPILNETSLFFDYCPARIVGITGTRGKSTTTVLLGHILKTAKRSSVVSGNVRQTMMLDVLDQLNENDLAVLELSSFQLEYLPQIERSPSVAIMTNLKIDHLNRYNSLTDYAQAKLNMFRYQSSHDVAVLNAENSWTRRAAKITSAKVWWFQLAGHFGHDGLTVSKGWVMEYHGVKVQRLFPVGAALLKGQHNLQNILAAAAAARSMNVPAAFIAKAVKNFRGVAHRQELVRTWRGHQFINDTTATTPDGTLAALSVFPKAVFIVGGTDKVLQYRQLAQQLLEHRTPMVFLPGKGTDKLLAALHRAGDHRVHIPVDSMSEAVGQAVSISKAKQPIVLSPGAASFGLFVHEFDRGEQFIRAVNTLR